MKDEINKSLVSDNSQEPETELKANTENLTGKSLIGGKFKSYEDLEAAYENAEKKLTQTSQRLAVLEKELTKSSGNQQASIQPQNIAKDSAYIDSQKKLLMRYLPYSKNSNAKTLNDFIAGLPPQMASQLGADLRELKSDFETRTQKSNQQAEEEKKQAVVNAINNFEQQYKDELEKPTKKIAFDFYKSFGEFSPEQASAVLSLTDEIISAYETQQSLSKQLSDENNFAKSKLTSSATSSLTNAADSKHVYSRAEINEMIKTPAGREKFLKVEKIIFDQMAKGLIK